MAGLSIVTFSWMPKAQPLEVRYSRNELKLSCVTLDLRKDECRSLRQTGDATRAARTLVGRSSGIP